MDRTDPPFFLESLATLCAKSGFALSGDSQPDLQHLVDSSARERDIGVLDRQ